LFCCLVLCIFFFSPFPLRMFLPLQILVEVWQLSISRLEITPSPLQRLPLVALAQYDCNRFSLFLSFSLSLTESFSPFLVIVPSRCLDKKRPHQLWDPPRSLRSLPEILSFHPIFFFLSIYKHTQTLYWMDVYVDGTCIYISLSLKSSSGRNKNSRKYLEVRGALDEGVQLLGRFRRAYFFCLSSKLHFATADAAAIFQEELTC
jgi:hypothetical protein